MIRKKNLIISAAGAALVLTGCGQKQEENSIPSVLDDGVLVVGILETGDRSCYRAVDAEGNPYYTGWEPDILTLLDKKMEDVSLEYRIANDRAELISWLNTGEVELAAGSFTRLDAYSTQDMLSDDYGFGSLYIVNPKNGYLDTLAAFQDEAVGISTQIPVNNLSQMKGVDSIVQQEYADMAVLGQDIANGVVAAGICTEDETMYLLTNTDLQAAEMRSTPQVGMVFLAQVGQDTLMSWVNYAIDLHYYNIARGITGEEENAGEGSNMAYFDSAKNRAMWNRELAELRQEKERRAIEGYKPGKTEVQKEAEKSAKETDPRRRRINLAELERIEARAGKIRKIKRPTRENAYVKGQTYPEYGEPQRKQK